MEQELRNNQTVFTRKPDGAWWSTNLSFKLILGDVDVIRPSLFMYDDISGTYEYITDVESVEQLLTVYNDLNLDVI
jgi:hypothetical protein